MVKFNTDTSDGMSVSVGANKDALVWFGQLRSLRCNSIKGSLRVALVNSSLLNMDLYTGGSPMSIQILTMRTRVLCVRAAPEVSRGWPLRGLKKWLCGQRC